MHPNSGARRRHSDEFKAKVLAACDAPGASISGVALAHGLNTNLVRKWRCGRGARISGVAITPMAPGKTPAPLGNTPEFIAIEMPAPRTAVRDEADPAGAMQAADPLIQVELRRGPLHLNVRWPAGAAQDCAAWLRELSAGLLK